MANFVERVKEENQQIIQAMFEQGLSWVRHYSGIIVQVNSLAVGGSSAIIAYFISIRWGVNKPPAEFVFLLLVPLTISGFAIWSTMIIVKEVQTGFDKVIKIERCWKVFEKDALIPNEFILEERYQNSGRVMQPVPKHLMVVQCFLIGLTLFVAGLSLSLTLTR